MAGVKRVLVQYQEYCRCVVVDPSSADPPTAERNILQKEIPNVFSDVLSETSTDQIVLQLKDEEWNGMFVDFTQDEVQDKNVYRVFIKVPKPVQVCCKV